MACRSAFKLFKTQFISKQRFCTSIRTFTKTDYNKQNKPIPSKSRKYAKNVLPINL